MPLIVVAICVALFAVFPLTDTDIWWHLACAREWVTTWTPVREPVVNVHAYFQQVVAFVYALGGAPLLVAFKAVSWSLVFVLFVRPFKASVDPPSVGVAFLAVLAFIFRYQFEMRPVVFSLLFLGLYWNVIPKLLKYVGEGFLKDKTIALILVAVLVVQWVWCKCQGLYILGPLFVGLCVADFFVQYGERISFKKKCGAILFVFTLFLMPFLHQEGLALFCYPFGLLDRLVGLTPSAAAFASGIAENRSPFTLLLAHENTFSSLLMILTALGSLAYAVKQLLLKRNRLFVLHGSLLVTSILALVAERNFVLLLPVFFATVVSLRVDVWNRFWKSRRVLGLTVGICVCVSLMGLWCKSLKAFDASMVSVQRVPVGAAAWMASHPHGGRLFNDDRAGGYLSFVNPRESVYVDGRFMLKTSLFFERYMHYAEEPAAFLHDADSLGIDRAVLPLRYYAHWEALIKALNASSEWRAEYVDSLYVVFNKKTLRETYPTTP